MNSKWDKYLFGINQMRIAGKDDDISYNYCHNGIIYNILPCCECNFRRAKSNVTGQEPLTPPPNESMLVSPLNSIVTDILVN